MRRLRRADAARANPLRAVAFVWTLLIAFPLMFFGMAMAVDFTRVVIVGRHMATATHASALAAAYQFEPGRARIAPVPAAAAAVETMCVAQDQGATSGAAPGDAWPVACPQGGSASVHVQVVSPTTVRVTSSYRVEHLLLLGYFGYGDVDQTVTRTAAVCDPRNPAGPTDGFCVRPSR